MENNFTKQEAEKVLRLLKPKEVQGFIEALNHLRSSKPNLRFAKAIFKKAASRRYLKLNLGLEVLYFNSGITAIQWYLDEMK